MKSKVIKKIIKIFLWFFGTLFFLFLSFYIALLSPAFQTWATNRIGGYFSSQWGTVVRVEGVDVDFWKKIVLEGVFVKDQHSDTLLYAEKLKLDISTFNIDSNTVFISDVILKNATVKLKKHRGESHLNFQFIIDEFTSDDTTTSADSAKWNIGIGGITLDNIVFAYKIEEDPSHIKGINFSDLVASSVIGKISNIIFDKDTVFCQVDNLALDEKSGFRLKEFHATASISPVHMKLDQVKIFSNHSEIIANIIFKYKRYDDFNYFVDSVKMKTRFNSSNIEMSDVAYFTDELYGIKKRIFLNGDVSGTVSDIKGKNILLVIGDETSFMGNFTITGLPDINQAFMNFDAKELRTSKSGIEKIPLPPFNEPHSISLPENVSLFGIMNFKGNFSGFYNDFVAYGKFNTALGSISTDISMKQDTSNGKPIYKGRFSCTDFNLGRFFESEKYFGNITMNVNMDGKGMKKEDANVSLEGIVNSFDCYGYNYHNIDVKGKFAKNIFDGILSVKDDNLHLDFNGNMDFSKSPTEVNFIANMTMANLSMLNLLKSDDYVGVTAKVSVNAKGNNIDDATGDLKLNDVVYLKGAEVFNFNDMKFSIAENYGIKTILLLSDIADGKLEGKFKSAEIISSLNNFLSNYFPSRITRIEHPHKHKEKREQEFTYDIQVKNTKVLMLAFMPELQIATPSHLKGKYDEIKNDFVLNASFPSVTIHEYKFNKCNINASSDGESRFSAGLDCQRLALSDSIWIENISISSSAALDTMNFKLNWHNNTVQNYLGNIPGYISFTEKPKIKIKFLPTELIIADSSWTIDGSNEIVMDSSFISVRNLAFISGGQKVKVDGNISKVKEDQMYLILSSFSLENFNSLLKGTGFSLYGTISGNTSIGNIYDKPVFGSGLDIKNLKLNNELIGDGSLLSVYDSKKDMITFNGGFIRNEVGNIKFSGNYFPSKKEDNIEMDAEVNNFRLEFFEPFVKGNIENLKGIASAELKISGTPSYPQLSGVIKARIDNAHVNYLGTDYHFDGDIAVEPGSFGFSNLIIYDVNQNSAEVVNGKIFHNNFKNFQMDIDVKTNKFLCLNTTERDNSIYYGKFFATGIMNVFGYFDNINLSAIVKTDKAKNILGKNEYTHLSIPLSDLQEIGENSYISFVKNDTSSKVKPPKYKVNSTGFTMDFKLEATPDAQMQLIFDEKVGDVIKASGKGNIEMKVNEFGDFKMYGDYAIEDGEYLFTLKNVVNKKFRLENGGTIRWSGNPELAEINMNAVYQLRTSLLPLFYEYEQTEATRKRYPVDLVMNLNGKLLEPGIFFDVRLPTVDDFTRQQAYDRFKNSELEVNKQVFSLMFTNSFSTPSGMDPGQTAGGPGAGAVTSRTSTEVLSNQLSNWLSQISNQFDVGVHYRPGDKVSGETVNKDEIEVALSTQLFNDKMSIDGSVANNSNTTTSNNPSAIVGDINVDYKLTENGKLKAKAFNKANEGDILNTEKGPYTQGVGIFYREEFETMGELFKRFLGKTKKQKTKP